MVDAREGCREVEKEKRSQGVRLNSAADGMVHVKDVGGYVSVVEKAALLWATEVVGEGSEDTVEKGGDDAVVCVDD